MTNPKVVSFSFIPSGYDRMIRIDAYFFYQVGAALRPLVSLPREITKQDARVSLWTAHYWLESLLKNSVYTLRTCVVSGHELLKTLANINSEYGKEGVDLNAAIDFLDHYYVTTQSKTFEAILAAELQWGNLFLVQPKGGYDLNQLTENGIAIFPAELPLKVPLAITDAKEAARCIAFALPTAAAFHLHRLNELVLREFYDFVTGHKPRPIDRNIGAYIDAMKNYQFKDKKLFGALAMVKDFHRNPVLHPDDRLETVEEALALHGIVNTTISYMLSKLPPPELKLVSPPTDETAPKQIEEIKTAFGDSSNAV